MKIKVSMYIAIVLLVLLILGVVISYIYINNQTNDSITNFNECINAWNPVMESYPRQCRDSEWNTFTEKISSCVNSDGDYMTIEEAESIAIKSECWDNLKKNSFCNETTGTFWIDLSIEKKWCNPACVINVKTKQAEINWRCTGLIK